MPKLNCKICESPIQVSLKLKDSRVFHFCDNCEFTFLDEKYRLDAQAEKARYELHQNSIEDAGYVQFFQKFIDYAVSPYVQAGSKILDYGSGPEPVLAQLLKKQGYKVDTYDPFYNPEAKLELYDMIISTEVFEHFYEPMTEIKRIRSLMKPGAYLSIMTSFAPSLKESPDEFKAWWYKNDSTHVSLFRLKTFEFLASKFELRLLKDNGKDIVIFAL